MKDYMGFTEIGEECIAAGCHKTSTHVLTTVNHDDVLGDVTVKNAYCLEDALYFAAWLPYCYPGKFELVSILPPASELFRRDDV